MKEKVSIAKLVFRRIAEIWRTIPIEDVSYPNDNINSCIIKKVTGNSGSGFQKSGKRKLAYNNFVN